MWSTRYLRVLHAPPFKDLIELSSTQMWWAHQLSREVVPCDRWTEQGLLHSMKHGRVPIYSQGQEPFLKTRSASRVISSNTSWLSCPSRLYRKIFSIFAIFLFCEHDNSWEQMPPPRTSTTLPVCPACVRGRTASEENSKDNSCLLGNNAMHLIFISYFLESVLQILSLPCSMEMHTI